MRQNGFTLVELMVAILVMALIAGAVVMTARQPSGTLSADATSFAMRVAALRESAIASGRPASAWVSTSGYGFDTFRAEKWVPMASRTFHNRDWPRDTVVTSDGLVGQEASVAGGNARIIFDNLGLPESQTIVRLARGSEAVRVVVTPNGDVEVRK